MGTFWAPGYRFVNVLIHASATVLLWSVLHRLGVPAAWFAASVFGIHPVNVETVAWITERKNTLSAFFYFAATLTYLRYAFAEPNGNSRRVRLYALSLVLFLAALFSKTVVVTLPAALLLITWWKKGRISWRDAVPILPMVVLGLPFAWMTVWMEKHHVGATGSLYDWSFVERCLIAGRAVWFYAGKLVFPRELTFIYPRWDIDSHQWWQFAFPVSAAALIVGLWLMRTRVGRGPLTGVLFFVGTLAPALGFINVYPMRFSFVADH